MAWLVCRAWWRKAAAMFVAPARRRMLMAVLRSAAMMCGAAPARVWERSSSKVTSRTQCSRFSMPQWPCTQAARTVAGAVARSAEVIR